MSALRLKIDNSGFAFSVLKKDKVCSILHVEVVCESMVMFTASEAHRRSICFSVENILHTIKGHPKPLPDVSKASVNLNPESISALHKRVK